MNKILKSLLVSALYTIGLIGLLVSFGLLAQYSPWIAGGGLCVLILWAGLFSIVYDQKDF